MPKLLALETATEACSVTLLVEDKQYEYFDIVPRRHADLILGKINTLLSEANISLSALDAIAFGCGPGSFMGVRIATGVTQGLAFGISCPVIPISTLQVLAQTAYQKTQATRILVGWDARMNGIYWGAYELGKNGVMEPVVNDALDYPEQVRLPVGEWVAVGNAWQVYQGKLPDKIKKLSKICDIHPNASAIIPIAMQKLKEGKYQLPTEVAPVYLRDQVTN